VVDLQRGDGSVATGASAFSNIFACLVHEDLDSVVDLVENLRFFEPDAIVLVYDGSDGRIRREASALEEIGAVLHPTPRPMAWGRLHEFVFDCLEYALDSHRFDALTFVDSDQLLAHRGYSGVVQAAFGKKPNVGMVVTPNRSQGSEWASRLLPREAALWEPFRERFSGAGAMPLPRWILWPGTVIGRSVAPALLELRDDALLAGIVEQSALMSEETVFPTLAFLLGYETVASPWSGRWMRWRPHLRVSEVAAALDDPTCFWLHPVKRSPDDPARAFLRRMSNDYRGFTPLPKATGLAAFTSRLNLSPSHWKDSAAARARRVAVKAARRRSPE
jgi:hypothetical protein